MNTKPPETGAFLISETLHHRVNLQQPLEHRLKFLEAELACCVAECF
jgi:hypothetical protein